METCSYCHTEYKRGRNTTGKYCSTTCSGLGRSKAVVDAYLHNQTYEMLYDAGHQIRNGIRAHLIRSVGCKCVLCGWGEVSRHTKTGLPPLEVDHIDGDWKNTAIENLRVICPNCHSLTATYRGRNKGAGREYRRLREKDA